MTRNESRRASVWLTPATAVLAIAVMAAVAATTVLVTRHIRRQLTGSAAAGTPSSPPQHPEYTVVGKIRIAPGQYQRDGQGCRATNISPEAQVMVTDARGASLTYAPVGAGTLAGGHCDLPFTFVVRAGEGSYGIDVPHWGLAKYSEQDLASTLELTFG